MNKLRTMTLAVIIALNTMACKNSETQYAKEVRGSASDISEYLKLRGQVPIEWLKDRDFDNDGVNDAYIQPKNNPKIIYHTKSSDAQPTNEQEIRWYLSRE